MQACHTYKIYQGTTDSLYKNSVSKKTSDIFEAPKTFRERILPAFF